jgi:hypothetical protein
MINGHNNKVEVASHVETMILAGHNNKIVAHPNSDQQVDTLIVNGHNNRLEHLIITGDLIVSGHNNIFNGLKLAGAGNIQDSGLNNKYNECYQISNLNGA